MDPVGAVVSPACSWPGARRVSLCPGASSAQSLHLWPGPRHAGSQADAPASSASPHSPSPLPPEVDPRPRGGSSDALIGPGPQSGGEISCDPQPSLASGACARGSHRALPVDPPWGGRWPGCGLCARACSPGCVRAGVLSQVRAVCAALRGRSPRKLGEGLPDTLPCPKVSDRHSAPKPTAANNKQH